MYVIIVFLLLFALPVGSVLAEHSYLHSAAPLMLLAGKWFVFWAVGIRLFLAGIRQSLQPKFTARQIFEIESDEVLPIVQELGFANLSMGLLGIVSLPVPAFVLPAAVVGGFYYGLAGIKHTARGGRNFNSNVAMITDLYVFAILASYVAMVLVPGLMPRG
jgi:hypothetical protein